VAASVGEVVATARLAGSNWLTGVGRSSLGFAVMAG